MHRAKLSACPRLSRTLFSELPTHVEAEASKSCSTHFECSMQNGMHGRIESRAPSVGHKITLQAHRCAKQQMLYVFVVASRSPSAYKCAIHSAVKVHTQSGKSLFAGWPMLPMITERAHTITHTAHTRTQQTLLQRCKFWRFASGSMRHSHKSNSLRSPLCHPLSPSTARLNVSVCLLGYLPRHSQNGLSHESKFISAAAVSDGLAFVLLQPPQLPHAHGKYS